MVNVYILCEGQTEEQFVKQVLYPTVSRIQAIRTAYPSPEFIDDSPDTAPSKRIKSLSPQPVVGPGSGGRGGGARPRGRARTRSRLDGASERLQDRKTHV